MTTTKNTLDEEQLIINWSYLELGGYPDNCEPLTDGTWLVSYGDYYNYDREEYNVKVVGDTVELI